MPRTRMALKRPAPPQPIPPPDERGVPEQLAASSPSSSDSDASDDAVLSQSEANADEYSDDGGSSDAAADAHAPSPSEVNAVSIVNETLKRDHR